PRGSPRAASRGRAAGRPPDPGSRIAATAASRHALGWSGKFHRILTLKTPVRSIVQLLGHAIVLTMVRLAALVRAHPDAASVVTLILLSFLALGRGLLPGKVLSAADNLFLVQPWRSLAPGLQPGNPLLSDATILFQPWLIYAAGEIGQGRFPLWNPHVFAGSPFFA